MKLSPRRVIGGGGDGGCGADIILKVTPHLYDLIKFKHKRKIIAPDGERGKEYNKKGKDSSDCVVYVPKGTKVLDLEGNVIVDLIEDNQEHLICKGGRGGKGNYKKLYSLPPQAGEEKEVVFYYCIPNDVVILGLPNCGKTSLFNKLTGKSYKVADYPFTTTSCVWAPAEIDYKRFIILDTPPLKENITAAEENRFLKHLSRSKIILLLSDNLTNCKDDFLLIKKIVSSFNPSLLNGKKLFYLLAKVDKIDTKDLSLKSIIPVSTVSNVGIEKLKKKILKTL
jgi:GTP-binding protein